MYSTLLLECKDNIATITLNRPDKRNAISAAMISDIQSALDAIEKNHTTRVVILTGAGKAFCAGMDLDMLAAIAKQSPAENQEDSRRIAKLLRRIWAFPRPMIAAVNGAAYEAGCRRFDSALTGLGGCPFAGDNLIGNIATEQVIAALKKAGADPGVDPARLDKILAMTNEIRATYAHAPLAN